MVVTLVSTSEYARVLISGFYTALRTTLEYARVLSKGYYTDIRATSEYARVLLSGFYIGHHIGVFKNHIKWLLHCSSHRPLQIAGDEEV